MRSAALWIAGYAACVLVCAVPNFISLHNDPYTYVSGPGFREPDATLDLLDQVTLSLIFGALFAVPLFFLLISIWLCLPPHRRQLVASRIRERFRSLLLATR